MFDGYYFKGRGFLWHDKKGPPVWWPLNWLWFFWFEFKRTREDAREEKAAARAAKDAAKADPAEPTPDPRPQTEKAAGS